MQTSFLYQMMGAENQICTRTEYSQGGTILHIQTKENNRKSYCIPLILYLVILISSLSMENRPNLHGEVLKHK